MQPCRPERTAAACMLGKAFAGVAWEQLQVAERGLRLLRMQALKRSVQEQSTWGAACCAVSSHLRRSLLDDFYRRQNDIIDSLIEARSRFCTPQTCWKTPLAWRALLHRSLLGRGR